MRRDGRPRAPGAAGLLARLVGAAALPARVVRAQAPQRQQRDEAGRGEQARAEDREMCLFPFEPFRGAGSRDAAAFDLLS